MATTTTRPAFDLTTRMGILNALGAGQITSEDADKRLATLRTPVKLTIKVSQKGVLSVYGLQRNPVSLYPSQWVDLFGFSGEVLDFIRANDGKTLLVDEKGPDFKPTGRKVPVLFTTAKKAS